LICQAVYFHASLSDLDDTAQTQAGVCLVAWTNIVPSAFGPLCICFVNKVAVTSGTCGKLLKSAQGKINKNKKKNSPGTSSSHL
jgi:hypothetical protein